MEKHNKINEARKTLKLEESATIPEIKEAYRKLSLKFHPDKCKEKDKKKCEEKFKKINNANEILIEYCLNYRFPFNEIEDNETREENLKKEQMKRFHDVWWEGLNDE